MLRTKSEIKQAVKKIQTMLKNPNTRQVNKSVWQSGHVIIIADEDKHRYMRCILKRVYNYPDSSD